MSEPVATVKTMPTNVILVRIFIFLGVNGYFQTVIDREDHLELKGKRTILHKTSIALMAVGFRPLFCRFFRVPGVRCTSRFANVAVRRRAPQVWSIPLSVAKDRE